MALRQTTGFVESLLRLIGLDWMVPDFSTLSSRQKSLNANIPYGFGWPAAPAGRQHPHQGFGARSILGSTRKSLEIRAVEFTTSGIGDTPATRTAGPDPARAGGWQRHRRRRPLIPASAMAPSPPVGPAIIPRARICLSAERGAPPITRFFATETRQPPVRDPAGLTHLECAVTNMSGPLRPLRPEARHGRQ